MPRFRRIAFKQVIQGLGRFGHRDPDYAWETAIGISKYGYTLTSVLLKAVVWFYMNFAPARAVFDRFARYRKDHTTEQRLRLTVQYANLVDYMCALNSEGRDFSVTQSRSQTRMIP